MEQNNITKTLAPKMTLRGNVAVISSKSELHRLIFCACLADRPCTIAFNSSLSKDIEATISCFRALGAQIEIGDGEILIKKPLDFEYIQNGLEKDSEIFCNESGSTARFILPLVSLLCKNGAVLTGAGKLPERPFSDLCGSLSAHGAIFSGDKMPIKVVRNAKPCDGATFEISGNISSQYLSGLLFILPLCKNSCIRLTTPLESAGYVDMTIDAMKKFGVDVVNNNGVYTARGEYRVINDKIRAFGDWSNAAFFLCGATQEPLTVSGIDPSSLQPDKKILDLLTSCGIIIEEKADLVIVKRGEKIRPFSFDAGENPDLVPILCVLAASIAGDSVISNIRRLRFKESDRVATVIDMISSLGGKICEEGDCIRICGSGKLLGGRVNSHNDHRIAMSAAIASIFCENDVIIDGAQAVAKSYPDFFETFKTLTEET
ncbi:MAG: 3-phosphoshikimate 1-carboxyvinyltransferase [Ruminococcaceae bacterium]|nr:3-phosphoshikimate 1-carboxyvinyltransferase [Oscillospiraceae bacterium]